MADSPFQPPSLRPRTLEQTPRASTPVRPAKPTSKIGAADVAWGALIAATFTGALATDDKKWKGRLLALGLGMSVNLVLEHALRRTK